MLFYLLQKNIKMIKIGNSTSHISTYTCQPKSKDELRDIINKRIDDEGFNCDLNDIDTSLIDDMSFLFNWLRDFNGDISKWNVSNVKNMAYMFCKSTFDQDISNWDVSNVTVTAFMFANSEFNGDISKWNVSNVKNARGMFFYSKFNNDINEWKINKRQDTRHMFDGCPIKEEYKPKSLKK